MSLTSALGIAQRSLLNTGRQTTVVSRNLADQSNPDYSRRVAVLASTGEGARVLQVQRAASEVLAKQNLAALSSASGQQALLDGLGQIAQAVNGASNDATVSNAIGKLQEALQLYAASPSNRSLAMSAVEAARTAVSTLNDATASVQNFRADKDAQIAQSVDDLRSLLDRFKQVNQTVVSGSRTGADVNDALDERDALLKQISQIIPVTATTRTDNDVSLITRDGITLFDKIPRAISFEPTRTYDASVAGGRVSIDGVPVSSASSGNTGTLGALLQLRDEVAPTMQTQLDEMARALVDVFADNGTVGLITWAGTGTTTDAGFAGVVRINALYDHAAGGDPELVRGAGTEQSDTTLLNTYLDRLDAPRDFSADAGLGSTTTTLGNFASNSVSWLEAQRKTASASLESKNALASRTAAALSNMTGVNVDEEMSLLLELEHSYQASARIIKAVDEMLATLLAAVN